MGLTDVVQLPFRLHHYFRVRKLRGSFYPFGLDGPGTKLDLRKDRPVP